MSSMSEHDSSTAPPGQKPVRRCCESCHQRKVRCDVDFREGTCKNCSLDGRPCKIRTPLKRGRKKRVLLQETSAPIRDELVTSLQRCVQREEHEFDNSGHASSAQIGIAPAGDLDNGGSTTAGYIPDPDMNINILSTGDQILADSNVPFYYHKYLKVADMSHLLPGQFHTLELNGCFRVPIDSYLDVFVHQYFLYVHTCLPLLNEGDFWAMYSRIGTEGGKPSGFSLALFQAMLFAASRFVPINMINACGFKDLKSMRDTFHRRAELLLTHHLETDSIVLAQTSLLLSLQPTIYDQSLNSMWLSKAISYAEDAGANIYFTKPCTDTDRMLENKRLWWCCILRDRMIAIGARRSIQINSEKFDFKHAGLQEADLADEVNKSNVYSPEMKQLLVKVIMAQCALAAAMTATMTAVYPTSNPPQGPSSVSQLVTATVEIERGNTELIIWARRFETELTDCIEGAPDPSVAALFANMTLIHYYSAQVALYNHLALVLQKHRALLEDFRLRFINLQKDLQQAIAGVTGKFQGLRDAGLAHRLPISAPSCTALPLILETLNLQLSSPAQKATHQRQLSCYNEIISLLGDQHEYTGCVTSAINSLLPIADAEIKQLYKSGNRLPSTSNAGSKPLNMALSAPSSWSDVFMKSPMIYLRISMSLDIALCQGKTPHVTDLPAWMRNLQFLSPSMPKMMLLNSEYRSAGEAEEVVEGLDQATLEMEPDFDIMKAGPFTEGLGFVCEDLASLGSIGLWLNST